MALMIRASDIPLARRASVNACMLASVGSQSFSGCSSSPFMCLMLPLGKMYQFVIAQSYSKERSEEHTSELQSLMRNSYDVFFLKTKKQQNTNHTSKKTTYTTSNT